MRAVAGRTELLGATIDDAVGEAYNKVARYLGLGYPGGPVLDRLAADGDPNGVPLPRPMRGQGLDVSLSGLKTAAVRATDRSSPPTADVAASFQAAVVEMLLDRCDRAVTAVAARSLALGGGVAANSALRAGVAALAERRSITCALPSLAYCTDNAAMIAAAGFDRLARHGADPLSVPADPSLALELEVA